jgi:tetratricopeptide (TPR) repeat protein
MLFVRGAACLALLVACAPTLTNAQVGGRSSSPGSGVLVHVEEASGGPIQVQAFVTLSSTDGPEGLTGETRDGGIASFRGVSAGEYSIVVTAPGYETGRDNVMVMGRVGAANVYIAMRPRVVSATAKLTSATPVLTGKARKELDLAIAALQNGKASDALRHVDYPLKHAPGDPTVHYVAAICDLANQDFTLARTQLEKTIEIFPDHGAAHLELGDLFLQRDHDADSAIPHLERALALDANSWLAHWLLAKAYLVAGRKIDSARFHAARAMALGKEKAASAAITLAYAQALTGDPISARATLEEFLRRSPRDPAAPQAQALLASSNVFATAPLPALLSSLSASVLNPPEPSSFDLSPAATDSWLPPDTDAVQPPVEQETSCVLADVLEGAGRRASELVISLERFASTEVVTNEELDSRGGPRRSEQRSFDYVAVIDRPRSDRLVVHESRSSRAGPRTRSTLMSEGISAIGFLFEPAFAQDFSFSCEGLSQWQGRPAWQVRFEERLDRDARILGWVANNQPYSAALKGRAWIEANSYHVLHIETDLLKPISQIRLSYDHIAISYAPVVFEHGNTELWLPSSATVHIQLGGRFYREHHQFNNFLLFSVDTIPKAPVSTKH